MKKAAVNGMSREDKIAAALAGQRAAETARRYAASDKAIKAALAPFINAALDLWEGERQRYTETPDGITAEGITRAFLDRIIGEGRPIGEEGAALEALAEVIQSHTGGRRRGSRLQDLIDYTTAADPCGQDHSAVIIPFPCMEQRRAAAAGLSLKGL